MINLKELTPEVLDKIVNETFKNDKYPIEDASYRRQLTKHLGNVVTESQTISAILIYMLEKNPDTLVALIQVFCAGVGIGIRLEEVLGKKNDTTIII